MTKTRVAFGIFKSGAPTESTFMTTLVAFGRLSREAVTAFPSMTTSPALMTAYVVLNVCDPVGQLIQTFSVGPGAASSGDRCIAIQVGVPGVVSQYGSPVFRPLLPAHRLCSDCQWALY